MPWLRLNLKHFRVSFYHCLNKQRCNIIYLLHRMYMNKHFYNLLKYVIYRFLYCC